jgi:hypothetical protein
LLHALAGDVTRNRRVLALAGDLVDLVDIDDARFGALDIVVGGLDEFEQDVLDILADVASFCERGGVGYRKGDIQHPCQSLRQKRLATSGRAKEHDVGLGELNIAFLMVADLYPLVVVVDRDGKNLLGRLLTDDVIV